MQKTIATVLDVRNLHVDIHTPQGTINAVRDVSFHIEKGSTFGLVGESGSGKSMTAMAISGLLPESATARFSHMTVGDMDFSDASVPDWRRLRRDSIGLVFQNPMKALNPRLTIGTQIREALPDRERRSIIAATNRAVSLMESVGVNRPWERLRQYPHELSGGLAQRMVIALALARGPELLIADEPTTALDVSIQAQILDLLEDLKREYGLACLLVSHDLDVIRDRADMIAVMHKGIIVEQGKAANVLAAPQADYTQMLLASMPGNLVRPLIDELAAPTTEVVAEVSGVNKSFLVDGLHLPWRKARSRMALRDISLKVHAGRSLGIVGESGSGKTTLARLIAGLDSPDSGKIHLAEKDVQFVFQDNSAALDPFMTIAECIEEPLWARGIAGARRKETVSRLLAEVGLDDNFAQRRPHQLSGGQRQRVGIARALAPDPRLILADEPVSALDVSVQAKIMSLLNNIRARRGLAYIVISHDICVIRYVCTEIAVLFEGEIVEYGTVSRVLDDPQHPYTRGLIAAVPGKGKKA